MTNYLTTAVEALVAYETVARPLDALSKRSKRVRDEIVPSVVGSLRRGNETDGPCYARLESKSSQLARGMRDGIDAFKKAHPKYGKALEGFIQEKRGQRKTSLVFGGSLNEIPDEVYHDVLMDIGIPENHVRSVLQSVYRMTDDLDNQRNETKVLV